LQVFYRFVIRIFWNLLVSSSHLLYYWNCSRPLAQSSRHLSEILWNRHLNWIIWKNLATFSIFYYMKICMNFSDLQVCFKISCDFLNPAVISHQQHQNSYHFHTKWSTFKSLANGLRYDKLQNILDFLQWEQNEAFKNPSYLNFNIKSIIINPPSSYKSLASL
jgi:hypothetical protein